MIFKRYSSVVIYALSFKTEAEKNMLNGYFLSILTSFIYSVHLDKKGKNRGTEEMKLIAIRFKDQSHIQHLSV